MFIVHPKKSYNDIFNKLYQITNGTIILSGSLSLKYRKIIDRDVSDLDVNILKSDWELYKSAINNSFRIIPSVKINYISKLEYDVYSCFDKITKSNEFHLFVNYSDNIFDIMDDMRILKVDYHLIDKDMILKSGQDIEKHSMDIESMKKYLYDK